MSNQVSNEPGKDVQIIDSKEVKINKNSSGFENEVSNLNSKDELNDNKVNQAPNPQTKDKGKIEEKPKEKYIPFKADNTYCSRLKEALKLEKYYRPKTIFKAIDIDRTKTTEQINLEEEQAEKERQQNIENALKVEEGGQDGEINRFLKYEESNKNGHTLIEDPMGILIEATKIYIDQYYNLSDLFVCCPLYYNYRISVEYDVANQAFYQFDTREISPICSHNCCPNQSREIDINLINYTVGQERKEQTFLELRKEFRRACLFLCGCCTRPVLKVKTKLKEIGKIIEIRTICNPVLEIYDANEELRLKIIGNCMQCGYCCSDLISGCCADCEFSVYEKKDDFSEIVGKLFKTKRSGKKLGPDYDQMEIIFPNDSIVEEKILLMCAGIFMEYLYFQHISNKNKCSGHPPIHK